MCIKWLRPVTCSSRVRGASQKSSFAPAAARRPLVQAGFVVSAPVSHLLEESALVTVCTAGERWPRWFLYQDFPETMLRCKNGQGLLMGVCFLNSPAHRQPEAAWRPHIAQGCFCTAQYSAADGAERQTSVGSVPQN